MEGKGWRRKQVESGWSGKSGEWKWCENLPQNLLWSPDKVNAIIGERVGKIMSFVSERCKIKAKSDGEEYLALIGNFLNNIRLRANNGWTPSELCANPPIAAPSTPVIRRQPAVGRKGRGEGQQL